jgi:hypothetical protein
VLATIREEDLGGLLPHKTAERSITFTMGGFHSDSGQATDKNHWY